MCLNARSIVNKINELNIMVEDIDPHIIGITDKGRYKDMREYLAKIDWNNTLKNKTATECWNILKSEIDCVVDKFVPLKKQGKRSKKKHLSKEEAIRKIKYKQMMWKTYRHTGSEEDYSIYKEALKSSYS